MDKLHELAKYLLEKETIKQEMDCFSNSLLAPHMLKPEEKSTKDSKIIDLQSYLKEKSKEK